MKAVLTSVNTANISVTFSGTLTLYAHNHNHCFAVLCTFLGGFRHFWKERFFLKG